VGDAHRAVSSDVVALVDGDRAVLDDEGVGARGEGVSGIYGWAG
jgi:hypothetical protein